MFAFPYKNDRIGFEHIYADRCLSQPAVSATISIFFPIFSNFEIRALFLKKVHEKCACTLDFRIFVVLNVVYDLFTCWMHSTMACWVASGNFLISSMRICLLGPWTAQPRTRRRSSSIPARLDSASGSRPSVTGSGSRTKISWPRTSFNIQSETKQTNKNNNNKKNESFD